MSLKKLLPILLILIVFAIALSACSLQSSTELENPSEPTSIITEPTSPPESVVYTRKDLEDAVTELAWDYYLKGNKLQYCSQDISVLGKYYNGDFRLSEDAAPEDGTSHTSIYSVCSDYIYKVYYEALDHRLFDAANSLGATTTAMWTFSEDIVLFRWFKDGYSLTATETEAGVTTNKQLTTKEARTFLSNWKTNLRPGDVIVPQGHALLYIGNGLVLDCWGRKYETSMGREYRELNGGVNVLRTIEDVFINGTDPVTKKTFQLSSNYDGDWFVVLRPLDALVITDSDSDPDNDITKQQQWQLPADTQTRLSYPAMEIDRTVSSTPYGTAVTGQTLTYQIMITNNTNEERYLLWRQASDPSYAGEAYSKLPVTEHPPVGTRLLESTISHNGTYENGCISWSVDLAAGQSIVLSYQVQVTAATGSSIVAENGTVGNICSNTICNTVGTSLPQAAVSALTAFAEADRSQWEALYQISANAKGTAFAQDIYQKVMGIDLTLPSIEELLHSLFDYQKVTSQSCSTLHPGSRTQNMFCWNTAEDQQAQSIRNMVVAGYFGGRKVYLPDRNSNINEFRTEYLEPGDILIFLKTSGSTTVTESLVAVYCGGNTLVLASSTGQTKITDSSMLDLHLWKAFTYDVFFTLRPSQTK